MNIKVINSDKTYKCILTYHDDEYNTDYMLYTDNSYNKDNSLKVYLSKYNPLSKEMIAQAIEDKKEYYAKISDKIWEYAEPRFQEYKSFGRSIYT